MWKRSAILKITILISDNYPCGYFCLTDHSENYIHVPNVQYDYTIGTVNVVSNCNGINECKNTDIDESSCETVKGEEQTYTERIKCDGTCQWAWLAFNCEDESICNGYQYGLWCENGTKYTQSRQVCDGNLDCNDGMDENSCTKSDSFCLQEDGKSRPLFNHTRCSVRKYSKSNLMDTYLMGMYDNFCADFFDQTNCSDYSKVAIHCSVHGFPSTISQEIICMNIAYYQDYSPPDIPQLCDDGLDKSCIQLSISCYIHKHLMCDEEVDCSDRADESHQLCRLKTNKKCKRRYIYGKKGNPISFPMAWIMDGTNDCWEGEDEIEWPVCGAGPTARFVKYDQTCQEVFLCHQSNQFVQFDSLCDKLDTCGNENKICQVSRGLVMTYSKTLVDSLDQHRLSICVDGLNDVLSLSGQVCKYQEFVFPAEDVFGRNHSSKIILPDGIVDCRHVYGEYYLFWSCLGFCSDKNTTCPLVRPIRYSSCHQQWTKENIFTKESTGEITFLTRKPRTGLLSNEIFVCKNRKCMDYKNVCDLKDDCGDKSDEEMCKNHFACKTSKMYLSISQKCDNVIHCSDLSDECNESCGQQIVNSYALKIMSWTIGSLSVVLNSIALIQSIPNIRKRKSEPAFLNNFLVSMISVGDLLVGCYLLAIASFDAHYGSQYCKNQLDWLTSKHCLVLGATSTFGSLVSLFSMTALSLIRVSGVRNEMTIPRDKNRKTYLKMSMVALIVLFLSAVISFSPLLGWLEDFFINGIKYNGSNTLFLGSPNKEKHMAIFHKYYGRIATDSLRWSQIRGLVDNMFSEDYGGIEKKKLTFYGNDGVCLFKYFVDSHDPQRHFVVGVLACIFFCFVMITISYGLIAATSRKSTKKMTAECKNSVLVKNSQKLQRVTQGIIFTDFTCWVPFMITCTLHRFEVVDATPWYPLFTIIFLPINSVINPILYDNVMRNFVCKMYKLAKTNMSIRLSKVHTWYLSKREEQEDIVIELQDINNDLENIETIEGAAEKKL